MGVANTQLGSSRIETTWGLGPEVKLGVVIAIAGGLVAFGAARSWATVGGPGASGTLLDGTVAGILLTEGKIVGALGLLVAGAVIAAGFVAPQARRVLLVAAISAAVLAVSIAVVEVARGHHRFLAVRQDVVAADIADVTGLPFSAIRSRLESQTARDIPVRPGDGLGFAIGGGLAAAIGTGIAFRRGTGRVPTLR